MKAGKLDRQITIQRKSVTDGQYGDQVTWADHLTLWAEMKQSAEDTRREAEQDYAERIVTFVVRYHPDISETDRLMYETEAYEIVGLRETGRREGLEIKTRWIQ